jgi:hypothetical protein
MGLDMYLRVENAENSDEGDDQIVSWRKHGDLNAWFERLWIKKYKPEITTRTVRFGDEYYEISAFNVEKVYLDLEDLKTLFDDLLAGNLPSANGLFHTSNICNEDRLREDIEAISKACVEIALGKKVYYICWW